MRTDIAKVRAMLAEGKIDASSAAHQVMRFMAELERIERSRPSTALT